jgi:hypothetical protein
MKVIFLDHDGVMCLATEWGGRRKKQLLWNRTYPDRAVMYDCDLNTMDVEYRFDDFNYKAVRILNEILLETGAEIVVSSDWRFECNLAEMKDFYDKFGVIKGPIDYTPNLEIEDFKFLEANGKKGFEDERSIEIRKWLALHPEVTHWVAIDDLNMSNDLTNFVHTKRQNEGIKETGIKEKIMSYLV